VKSRTRKTGRRDSTSTELQVHLPDSLYQWLWREAQRRRATIPELARLALEHYAQEQDKVFDITQTRTWQLCGALDVAEPDLEYIVGQDNQGQVITNYAEHVDDVLYGGH
jgi:hypothetical protein